MREQVVIPFEGCIFKGMPKLPEKVVEKGRDRITITDVENEVDYHIEFDRKRIPEVIYRLADLQSNAAIRILSGVS